MKQLNLFKLPDAEQKHYPDGQTLADMIFDDDNVPTDDPVKKSKQKRLLWDALQGRPKTRMQLAVETGLMRSSICPIVDTWLKEGRLYLTGRARCPVTGHKADFLTANRKLFLESVLEKENPREL